MRPLVRNCGAAVLLSVIGVAWFTSLRPPALGGDASYVIVDGRSMEPTYEDGDLVLVRRSSSYAVGDVIAFRAGGHFDDPTRIIHRIVGDASNGGFKTQGDNRDRLDPWQPTDDDIIGRATLHIPKAGTVASAIARPETFAAMGGTAVFIGGTRRRRRRRPDLKPSDTAETETIMQMPARSTNPSPGPRPSRATRVTEPRWAFIGLVVAVLVAVPTLAMAWSALRAPDTTSRIEATGSVDFGIGLDYRFTGEPSAVYPDGVVTATRGVAGALTPSDPLYSRLLDRLQVTLRFDADQTGAEQLRSSAGAEVLLETPGGWSTPLETQPVERFEGTEELTFGFDLRAIAMQVASVSQLTGVGGGSYTITVSPTLDVAATAAETVVGEQLTAPMTFSVDGNLITASAADASQSRELTRTINERAVYVLGPFEVPTQTARAILSGLALVLVAGIAWFASVLFGGVGLGEPDRIAARYRSQIVDVATATAPPGPVVMVGGIDELARIAKVEQSVILHEDVGDGAHRYRVFLGSVTYEYETAPEHAGAAEAELATDADEAGG